MDIVALNGKVTLGIPKSYRGRLSVKTSNGWVNFSTALAPHVTTFSDVHGLRNCFVGDFTDFGEIPSDPMYIMHLPISLLFIGNGDWQGSSIYIQTRNGRVKLCYEDEMPPRPEDGAKSNSFIAKLFT